MANTDIQQETYNRFISDPSPKNAFDFIISCYKYITILATKWKQPSLTRKDKINEIISEMFLILLEDFSAGKAIACQSAFSYLDIKLNRLINPGRKHFFSDIDEVSNSFFVSKSNFTYEKIEMIEEIVKIVRSSILQVVKNKDGLLYFLFIHVYPKIRWISELLAKKENIPVESRYEADAKRINRFNSNLRKQFDSIESGDWHDILSWSQSERSHLAWKIINISPSEIEGEMSKELSILEEWRENFDIHETQGFDKLDSAEKVYDSLEKYYKKNSKICFAAEEADPWGTPIDIISMLIGKPAEIVNVEETSCDYKYSEKEISCFNNPESDVDFMESAQELSKWFGNMLAKRNKKAHKNTLSW